MGTLILCIIFGIAITNFLYHIGDPDKENKIKTFIIITSVSMLIGIIPAGITSAIIRHSIPSEEKPYSINELKALKDNKNLHGSFQMVFFVGGGYINESYYYCFYHKTNNGIRFKKVHAETDYPPIYLIERNGKTPQYVRYGKFDKKEYKDHWFYGLFYTEYLLEKTRDVLYIPEGSILTDYKLDAE